MHPTSFQPPLSPRLLSCRYHLQAPDLPNPQVSFALLETHLPLHVQEFSTHVNPLRKIPIESSEFIMTTQLGIISLILAIIRLSTPISASIQTTQISPGFQGAQMDWIDNDGIILLSNNSNFGFGFITATSTDITDFLLVVLHRPTSTTVWTANQDSLVTHSDNFFFDKHGNAYLESNSKSIWSTDTSGATAFLLQDSGNLVVVGDGGTLLWQSFSHPTDTLLSGQSFVDGMRLVSKRSRHNYSYHLTIDSGDMMLYTDFSPPQPYWSMQQDRQIVINQVGGNVFSAALVSNSWNFYDKKQDLLSQFIVDTNDNVNATQAAVLGSNGFITFSSLLNGGSSDPSSTRIPQDPCDSPDACDPYFICYSGPRCQCPDVLSSGAGCSPGIVSPCSGDKSFQFAKVEDGVGYFAIDFVSPARVSSLTGCKDACMDNCSCLALFHDAKSGNCYMFDQIGSFSQLDSTSPSYVSYIKITGNGGGTLPGNDGNGSRKHLLVVLMIILGTVAVIVALIYLAIRIHRRKRTTEQLQVSSDEDNFLETMSGMPVRFSYGELQAATDNFAVKLGQGGFGSVYLGKLSDGSRIAVKKLEGIGQGKKEFRAEVTIIGSIHHVHLVRLRGFCAEGVHRLLAYEYMSKGSLDRWIFRDNEEGIELDWDKRYSIALGTAKGLAYLHEDCTSKIIHCDIKPENVLLDENFHAKVSDFGLAKLMTREQSHVFTTLRGTRGYLAPEWITNYAISEKSDVYSFGMVLLEIIGGRKNYDPGESSEKSHFPSYAFKKLEEGRLKEIFSAKMKQDDKDERVETAIKVALWCIQEDLSLRPSMSKVVQMLEGLSYVPQPPSSTQMGFRYYANMYKSVSEEGSSSGPSDCNSDALLSAVRLSGPR